MARGGRRRKRVEMNCVVEPYKPSNAERVEELGSALLQAKRR